MTPETEGLIRLIVKSFRDAPNPSVDIAVEEIMMTLATASPPSLDARKFALPPLADSQEAMEGIGSAGEINSATPPVCPTCHDTRDTDVPCSSAFHIASLDAPAEITEDSKRLKWLADNYEGVDFEYGDPDNPLMVLVIRIPEGEGVRVTADFIDTIDALRKVPNAAV